MERDFAETLAVIAQRVGSSGEGSTELGLAVAETTGTPSENQRAGDDVESPASHEEVDYELISSEDECDN